ncbi:hypothetical protein AVEN_23758-1 [Araneus ventricosus]|uniref:Uncharacterized protein n=1 Tax=Araneus ventricosus TaxID=182803 RepID=A0A4Y2SEH4_ARAVE|nr:hypothetical protein AVEN_23758-1 [Araneus ventricosus]
MAASVYLFNPIQVDSIPFVGKALDIFLFGKIRSLKALPPLSPKFVFSESLPRKIIEKVGVCASTPDARYGIKNKRSFYSTSYQQYEDKKADRKFLGCIRERISVLLFTVEDALKT